MLTVYNVLIMQSYGKDAAHVTMDLMEITARTTRVSAIQDVNIVLVQTIRTAKHALNMHTRPP
jgi:hypothetical protein